GVVAFPGVPRQKAHDHRLTARRARGTAWQVLRLDPWMIVRGAIEYLTGAIGRAVVDHDPAAGPLRLRDHRDEQPPEQPFLIARGCYGDVVFHVGPPTLELITMCRACACEALGRAPAAGTNALPIRSIAFERSSHRYTSAGGKASAINMVAPPAAPSV